MNKQSWDWDAYGHVSKPRPGLHGGLHRHGTMPLHKAHMAVTVPRKEREGEGERECERAKGRARENMGPRERESGTESKLPRPILITEV